jgi:hypothetical protein
MNGDACGASNETGTPAAPLIGVKDRGDKT